MRGAGESVPMEPRTGPEGRGPPRCSRLLSEYLLVAGRRSVLARSRSGRQVRLGIASAGASCYEELGERRGRPGLQFREAYGPGLGASGRPLGVVVLSAVRVQERGPEFGPAVADLVAVPGGGQEACVAEREQVA
jgi:hypothetical protein